MAYNLTNRQKEILRKLVNGIRNEGWGETYLDVSGGSDYTILALGGKRGSLDLDSIYDMDPLVNEGLVGLGYNKSGGKIFTITQAAFDAVDNKFELQEEQKSRGDTNIGMQFLGGIAGGSFQGIGYANQSQIQQIVENPKSFKEEVEKIADQLIEIVKNNINSKQLIDYVELTKDIKEELQKSKPEESKLKNLLASLSFINDTSSSIELVSRILPYITMLTQLILARF